jgi:RNA polymerase sigma factor (sigma-70 family)
VAEQESRQQLWELAGEALTERQMTATWLYYVQEMPVNEIARVAGCSRGAVKTMLFRARKKLLPLVENRKPNSSAGRSSCQAAMEVPNG